MNFLLARLVLSLRNLPWELPPRQGDPSNIQVWRYYLGEDLGSTGGQLESALLQGGGPKVGARPQIYFRVPATHRAPTARFHQHNEGSNGDVLKEHKQFAIQITTL